MSIVHKFAGTMARRGRFRKSPIEDPLSNQLNRHLCSKSSSVVRYTSFKNRKFKLRPPAVSVTYKRDSDQQYGIIPKCALFPQHWHVPSLLATHQIPRQHRNRPKNDPGQPYPLHSHLCYHAIIVTPRSTLLGAVPRQSTPLHNRQNSIQHDGTRAAVRPQLLLLPPVSGRPCRH